MRVAVLCSVCLGLLGGSSTSAIEKIVSRANDGERRSLTETNSMDGDGDDGNVDEIDAAIIKEEVKEVLDAIDYHQGTLWPEEGKAVLQARKDGPLETRWAVLKTK